VRDNTGYAEGLHPILIGHVKSTRLRQYFGCSVHVDSGGGGGGVGVGGV
jgi:hypothetical protein